MPARALHGSSRHKASLTSLCLTVMPHIFQIPCKNMCRYGKLALRSSALQTANAANCNKLPYTHIAQEASNTLEATLPTSKRHMYMAWQFRCRTSWRGSATPCSRPFLMWAMCQHVRCDRGAWSGISSPEPAASLCPSLQ